MSLRLEWTSRRIARLACENYHYSKTIPRFKTAQIAVSEDDRFIGVVIFGNGASAPLANSLHVGKFEVAELTRVALKSHKTPVTRIISIALKMFKVKFPGIRLCVSFADGRQGHHGGIYQGGNWIYTGMSLGGTEYFFCGKWRHMTDMGKRFSKEERRKLIKRPVSKKHRYIMIFDPSLKDYFLKMKQPFPKRAGSIESMHPPHQAEEGGVNPIPALQNSLVI